MSIDEKLTLIIGFIQSSILELDDVDDSRVKHRLNTSLEKCNGLLEDLNLIQQQCYKLLRPIEDFRQDLHKLRLDDEHHVNLKNVSEFVHTNQKAIEHLYRLITGNYQEC